MRAPSKPHRQSSDHLYCKAMEIRKSKPATTVGDCAQEPCHFRYNAALRLVEAVRDRDGEVVEQWSVQLLEDPYETLMSDPELAAPRRFWYRLKNPI